MIHQGIWALHTLLFSCLVVSNSLWSHGQQHTRPPSPSPKACPSSCPLHQWCHPAISSSDALFSFCPPSFPASGTFPVSQLFASDDQNTGVWASASVLPVSIQGWFPLRWTDLLSLLSKGLCSSAVQGTRDQIANIHWNPRKFQKKTYLCFIDYAKVQRQSPNF